jgi:hypothetical protein
MCRCSSSSHSWCTSLCHDDGSLFVAHALPPKYVTGLTCLGRRTPGTRSCCPQPPVKATSPGGEGVYPGRLARSPHALVLPVQPDTDQSPPAPLRSSLGATESVRGTASSSHAGPPCPARPPSLAEQVAPRSLGLLPVQHRRGRFWSWSPLDVLVLIGVGQTCSGTHGGR